MKKDFLTPQAAANEHTRLALQKADDAFYRMRRTLEHHHPHTHVPSVKGRKKDPGNDELHGFFLYWSHSACYSAY